MITPPRVAVRRLALGRLISATGSLAAGTALNYELYERTLPFWDPNKDVPKG